MRRRNPLKTGEVVAPAAAAAMPLQLLLLLAALLACHSQASVQSDAELLLAFKETFTNGAQLLDTWSDGTALCPSDGEYKSNWTGVTCQDDRVVQLEVYDLGLVGTVPPTGWPLPDSLQILRMGNNSISGTISNWKLPPNLLDLMLYTNLLTGSISAPFTELPGRFRHLNVAGNRLAGTLPDTWKLPERLEILLLRNNSFTGPIPKAWKTQMPRKLTWLALTANNLTGTLPPDWDFPPELQGLLLGNNSFSGPLPAWPKLPSSISQLSLKNNQLTGTLPIWSNLTEAKVWLSGNPGLCGQVPQVEYAYVDVGELPSCRSPSPSSPSPSPPSPPVSPEPPDGSSSNGSSSSTGVIVGVAVGAVCLMALAGLAGWWWWRRRRQSLVTQGQQQQQGAEALDVKEPGIEGTLEQAEPTTAGTLTDASTPSRSDHAASTSSLLRSDPLISSIAFKIGSSTSSSRAHSERSRPELSFSQWTVAFRDIFFAKHIGKGGYGLVYLGRWNEIEVAVKLLLGAAADVTDPAAAADILLSDSNPAQRHLHEEAGILASLRHPNVLGFIGVCLKPPCILSEYCARGSLYDLLKEAKTSPALQRRLDWPRRLQMASDAAKGMLYLHNLPQPVVHRDLKSPNLLVSKNWSIKVSDFNMSRIVEEDSMAASSATAVTNPRWLAPEVIAGERPTLASDVFSYGVIMWEVLTWELPWADVPNLWQVASLVMDGGRLEVPAADQVAGGAFAGLDGFIALMRHCWAQDPQQRPSFNEIVAELRRLSSPTGRAASLTGQRSGSGNLE